MTVMEIIEIFKTNITDPIYAKQLTVEIHRNFNHYKANFDLLDCDNILRIASKTGFIDAFHLITFLERKGCIAEIL